MQSFINTPQHFTLDTDENYSTYCSIYALLVYISEQSLKLKELSEVSLHTSISMLALRDVIGRYIGALSMTIIWTWVDTFSAMMFLCQAILPPLAIAMLISGLDDLLVDALFVSRWIARKLKRRPRQSASDIVLAMPASRIAVLIPAWDESAIIADMLLATSRRWQHEPELRLFVGWYANDAATGRAIATIAAQDKRIVPVIVPHAGPTTKADCLNHLWAAAQQYATERQWAWLGFLLHDAEDLVSDDEPKMIRHMLSARGKVFVQFPVIPVPVPGSAFISGHYLDEFAESHSKDMVVREWTGAPLPAAGVGCAFEARALQQIATMRGGLPFNIASLTEDYELGLLISRLGPAAFVRIASEPQAMLESDDSRFAHILSFRDRLHIPLM